MKDYIIPISIIVLIIGGAILYIIKAKKSGRKCIGCPDGGSCQYKKASKEEKCCCGCSKDFYDIKL